MEQQEFCSGESVQNMGEGMDGWMEMARLRLEQIMTKMKRSLWHDPRAAGRG